jgi:hypothetical protein
MYFYRIVLLHTSEFVNIRIHGCDSIKSHKPNLRSGNDTAQFSPLISIQVINRYHHHHHTHYLQELRLLAPTLLKNEAISPGI